MIEVTTYHAPFRYGDQDRMATGLAIYFEGGAVVLSVHGSAMAYSGALAPSKGAPYTLSSEEVLRFLEAITLSLGRAGMWYEPDRLLLVQARDALTEEYL